MIVDMIPNLFHNCHAVRPAPGNPPSRASSGENRHQNVGVVFMRFSGSNNAFLSQPPHSSRLVRPTTGHTAHEQALVPDTTPLRESSRQQSIYARNTVFRATDLATHISKDASTLLLAPLTSECLYFFQPFSGFCWCDSRSPGFSLSAGFNLVDRVVALAQKSAAFAPGLPWFSSNAHRDKVRAKVQSDMYYLLSKSYEPTLCAHPSKYSQNPHQTP